MNLLEPFIALQHALNLARNVLNYDDPLDEDVEDIEKTNQDKISEIYKDISNNFDEFLMPGVKEKSLVVYIYCRWFPIEFNLIDDDIFTSKLSYYTWNIDT